jgi:deoxyribonuclease-4
MSIAGGYYKAVELAKKVGCDTVQLFTKNNNQWRAKPLSKDDVTRFKQALDETGITAPVAHDAYLINLASPDAALWKRSVDAFVVELERAEALGIWGVVTHPGSHLDRSEQAGIARVVEALDEVHRQTRSFRVRTLLETTAGQGTNLGWRFEQLAAMIDQSADPERIGVCVDTCHVFAAGYPLEGRKQYLATVRELDKIIGLSKVEAFHLNDSKRELGSRVDRHEHIGRGRLGLEPFRHLLNDRRFRRTPMYLETAKGTENGEDLDARNLRVLRGLIKKK